MWRAALWEFEVPVHDHMFEPEVAHDGSCELVSFQHHIEVFECDVTDLSLARIQPNGTNGPNLGRV